MQVARDADMQERKMQNARERKFEFQNPDGSLDGFHKSPKGRLVGRVHLNQTEIDLIFPNLTRFLPNDTVQQRCSELFI